MGVTCLSCRTITKEHRKKETKLSFLSNSQENNTGAWVYFTLGIINKKGDFKKEKKTKKGYEKKHNQKK